MVSEIKGKYYGTEINQKWWKRYTKDKMLARGDGVFSFNEDNITFLRKLTRVPIEIPFENIVGFKTGKWHAGQWGAGHAIIKVIWERGGSTLSSGFSIAAKNSAFDQILNDLIGTLEKRSA